MKERSHKNAHSHSVPIVCSYEHWYGAQQRRGTIVRRAETFRGKLNLYILKLDIVDFHAAANANITTFSFVPMTVRLC